MKTKNPEPKKTIRMEQTIPWVRCSANFCTINRLFKVLQNAVKSAKPITILRIFYKTHYESKHYTEYERIALPLLYKTDANGMCTMA